MTFQHETEGDNFEEQILYGDNSPGCTCFNVMVENGYLPSFAYAKAIRSLRSVLDVMDEKGIEEYLTKGSERTCEFAVRMWLRVINEDEIRKIFAETEKGIFARDWMQEWALGTPMLHRLRRAAAQSGMGKTGQPWKISANDRLRFPFSVLRERVRVRVISNVRRCRYGKHKTHPSQPAHARQGHASRPRSSRNETLAIFAKPPAWWFSNSGGKLHCPRSSLIFIVMSCN